MRITIVPEDNVVTVNGETANFNPVPHLIGFADHEDIHAIQFYEDETGEVEYRTRGKNNKTFFGRDALNLVLDVHRAWTPPVVPREDYDEDPAPRRAALEILRTSLDNDTPQGRTNKRLREAGITPEAMIQAIFHAVANNNRQALEDMKDTVDIIMTEEGTIPVMRTREPEAPNG